MDFNRCKSVSLPPPNARPIIPIPRNGKDSSNSTSPPFKSRWRKSPNTSALRILLVFVHFYWCFYSSNQPLSVRSGSKGQWLCRSNLNDGFPIDATVSQFLEDRSWCSLGTRITKESKMCSLLQWYIICHTKYLQGFANWNILKVCYSIMFFDELSWFARRPFGSPCTAHSNHNIRVLLIENNVWLVTPPPHIVSVVQWLDAVSSVFMLNWNMEC
jgi:hypothetical protein